MPLPWLACDRCGNWLSGDPHVAVGNLAYCVGPCAPWARVPSPFPNLAELGKQTLEHLVAEGLPTDKARAIVAWVEREALRWPGPRPWVTWRHAERAGAQLGCLLAWRPEPEQPRRWSGGMALK